MTPRLLVQRLLALFVAGLLLFDFPLLGLYAHSAVAVFVAWAAVIGVLAWLLESAGDEPD